MNSRFNFARIIRSLTLTSTLLFVACANIFAQQQATDGATPLGLSPGAPAGSYPLSDFENVNLFNGTLNFSLPLVKIGGRGKAGYSLTMRVDHKWLVQKEAYDGQPPINIYTPMPGWWTDIGWAQIYSMGRMETRQGGSRDFVLGSGGCGYIHRLTLTRLTFIAPDGSEYELRDQATNGQPVLATCSTYNRGSVFVTADGTAATFISDSPISDYQYDNPANVPPSGYMMLRDGTRYRVDGGKVSWMRDPNGNKLTFNYDSFSRMTSATDSLNRQVTINYDAGSGAYQEITYKGFGGATRSIKVYFASLSTVLRSDFTLLTTAQMFPELNGAGSGSHNPAVVSAVELPNGKQYQFRYNSYAELTRVVLPTGGAIEYDYAAGLTDSTTGSGVVSGLAQKEVYRRIIERRVYPDGGSGSGFASRMTYSRPETSTTNTGYVTTDQYNASGTLLTRAIHYFYGSSRASLFQQPTEYPAWTDGREYKTETFAANGTTLLRRVENTFQQRATVSWWTGGAATAPPNDVRVAETVTTLADSNQISKQAFGYDDTVPFNNENNVKEYDYGAGAVGPLVRETRTTYQTSATYTGTGVHIRNLPTQVSIYDGGGVERARTTYEYDNYTTVPLVDRTNISGFDAAFNTDYKTRGNPTGTTRYLLSGGAVTSSISSYSQYDIAGNVTKITDARGNATLLYYDDCFGAPNGEARTPSAPSELAGLSSYAFATSIKNPLNHLTYSQFDFYLGAPVDGEDANGVVASGTYNDSLDRPTQIRRAAGTTITNQTTFSYDDTNRVITTSSDADTNNDNLLVNKVVYDQMGRTKESQQYVGGTNYIAIQYQYDALGRLYKTSYPFRPWLSETPVWTTTAFDALSRTTSVTTPDSAAISSSYSGNSVRVTDQAGKARKSVTDALGRLIEVYEDPNDLNPNGLNYQTSYLYDSLDNLVRVTQGSQQRFFMYDSLKRLIRADNPEEDTLSALNLTDPVTSHSNWSVKYDYDNNGNLTFKTDARGVVTENRYDVLNRLTTILYRINGQPDPNTGDIEYLYDNATNGKGRLWLTFRWGAKPAQTAVGEYDALGRVKQLWNLFGDGVGGWSAGYGITRNYNLAGDVTSQTYPSGRTVNYSYDAAGRTTGFTGNLGDGVTRSYASSFVYNARSQVTQELFGTQTQLYHKLQYNIRGQLWDVRVSTGSDVNGSSNRGGLQYFYESNLGYGTSGPDNNGNVLFANTYVLGDDPNVWAINRQRYDYDSLNRLKWVKEWFVSNSQAESQQSVQTYDYDRWGNRTINTAQTSGTGINNTAFEVETARNRLYSPGDLALSDSQRRIRYDQAGNQTKDTYTGSGTATFDADNHIVAIQDKFGGSSTYTYNANAQRVRRRINNQETWQIYGIDGELVAEYAANTSISSPQKEYGYRDGELLITAASSGLKGNWKFDENSGTTAADSSGSSNNGTLTSGATWTTGQSGSAVNLDGVDDYVQVGAQSSLALTNAGTLSAWIYPTGAGSLATYGGIIINKEGEYELARFQDGTLQWAFANTNPGWNWINTGYVAPLNQWTHVAVTYDNGVVKTYINGTLTHTYSGAGAIGDVDGSQNDFRIGGRQVTSHNFQGRIDEVRVYQRPLSASEVTTLPGGSSSSSTQINWLVPDNLGTPRIILDQTGSTANLKRHDYLPFGEELSAGSGGRTTAMGYAAGDGIRQQFTSKERDSETGLDYFLARYYSSIQGRFTSPDEFKGGPEELFEDVDPHDPLFYADTAEPQSLNKYHYALNNPLRYVDPDGHQASLADRLKSGARSVGRTVMNTVEGVASAYGEDQGVGGTTGPQNSVGRGIGHTLSLVQSGVEIVGGAYMAVGGGAEAIATSPAALTVVGSAAPAVGVVAAVAGVGAVAHGAYFGANTLNNIFRHGNSASSNKPQHGYEIVDKTGDVKKVGVSGQPLNQNGTSPRANSQINKANKGRPFGDWLQAQIKKRNVPSRAEILKWERRQAELRRKQGNSMDMHTRP
jgi:RHS repeat-associated protein